MRFRDWVETDAEPIRLTLLGGVNGRARVLTIHTAHWLPAQQKDLRTRLKTAVKETRAAYNSRRPERAWVFAFTMERSFDELQIEATLEAGVDVLIRAMPRLPWRYRSTHRFITPSRRSPPDQPLPISTQTVQAEEAGPQINRDEEEPSEVTNLTTELPGIAGEQAERLPDAEQEHAAGNMERLGDLTATPSSTSIDASEASALSIPSEEIAEDRTDTGYTEPSPTIGSQPAEPERDRLSAKLWRWIRAVRSWRREGGSD